MGQGNDRPSSHKMLPFKETGCACHGSGAMLCDPCFKMLKHFGGWVSNGSCKHLSEVDVPPQSVFSLRPRSRPTPAPQLFLAPELVSFPPHHKTWHSELVKEEVIAAHGLRDGHVGLCRVQLRHVSGRKLLTSCCSVVRRGEVIRS